MGSLLPAEFPRRILLAVAGLSPQVITETLYALHLSTPAFTPTELHIITTEEGYQRTRLMLLTEEPGWLARLCRDYDIPDPLFGDEYIHILHDSKGNPLRDIRSEADNRVAADTITEIVRSLSADVNSALHVSLAGGRKTLGYYVGYALSLYGRTQDRLSHVLVSESFEGHHDFFYPTPYSRIIYTPAPDSRPLDCREARVSLADIPFLRLRHGLPQSLLSGNSSFNTTIRELQQVMDPPQLQLYLATREIQVGPHQFTLSPAEFAFYAFFLARKIDGKGGVRWTDEGLAEEYLGHYADVVGANSGDYERVSAALVDGMTKEYFEQRKAKTNSAMKRHLGQLAPPYLIHAEGSRPQQRFRVTLPTEMIHISREGQMQ